jgi:hypothetical protein
MLLSVQKDFAVKIGAELIILDWGHYIHHYESQKIAEKSKLFIYGLLK